MNDKPLRVSYSPKEEVEEALKEAPKVNYAEVVETEEAVDKSRSRSKLVKPTHLKYTEWLELRLAAKRMMKAMKAKQ